MEITKIEVKEGKPFGVALWVVNVWVKSNNKVKKYRLDTDKPTKENIINLLRKELNPKTEFTELQELIGEKIN